MSNITNLKGTTWYVPSGWSAKAGLGKFYINLYFDNDPTFVWASMYIGYGLSGEPGEFTYPSKANSIVFNGSSWPNYTPISSFTFTITGGTDVTNTKLIEWLTTYGIQLKVTDLTNTTWHVKAGWEAEAGYGEFNVTGRLISQTWNFTAISIGEDDGDYKDNYLCFTPYMAISNGEVANMSITGGTDVKNPKLIAWLSKFGELEGGEEEPDAPSITDLKGYTVTVPSGWSYLQYSTSTVTFDISGVFPLEGDYPFVAMIIDGYDDDNVRFRDESYYYSIYTSSMPFTIRIDGGSDATNASLIQWFVDNNATFEKEGGEEETPDTPEETPTEYGEIHYNGSLLTTIKAGQTVILHTEGLQAETDIVIKNVGETVKLISFTIENQEFQAEQGMTWRKWVDSNYSGKDSYISSDGFVAVYSLDDVFLGAIPGVKADEEIENGKAYTTAIMPN